MLQTYALLMETWRPADAPRVKPSKPAWARVLGAREFKDKNSEIVSVLRGAISPKHAGRLERWAQAYERHAQKVSRLPKDKLAKYARRVTGEKRPSKNLRLLLKTTYPEALRGKSRGFKRLARYSKGLRYGTAAAVTAGLINQMRKANRRNKERIRSYLSDNETYII